MKIPSMFKSNVRLAEDQGITWVTENGEATMIPGLSRNELTTPTWRPEKNMKRKAKIFFPVTSTKEREMEIEIPEGKDPKTWVKENAYIIISYADEHGECENVLNALELDMAGVDLLPIDELNPPQMGEKEDTE